MSNHVVHGTGELITSWDHLSRLDSDWERLWQSSDTCRDEFYSLKWMRAVASNLSRPADHPWCITIRENGLVQGIAPLYQRDTRVTGLNIPVRIVSFFPNNQLFRHGFLGARKWERLLAQVISHMKDDTSIDLLVLTGLEEIKARALFGALVSEGVGCSLLQVNKALGGIPGTASADLRALDLAGDWKSFLASRKKKYRKNLRSRSRKLSLLGKAILWYRIGGEQIRGAPLSVSEMTEEIQKVEADAWKTAKNIHLGRDGYDYVKRLLAIADEANALSLALLYLDDRAIAFNLGLVAGGKVRESCIAYDPSFRECSPGVLLRTRVIEILMDETNYRLLDLGGSNHSDKQELADLTDSGFELTVYANTIKGRLLHSYRKYIGSQHEFPVP